MIIDKDRIKVLFIAGSGRSGSTILQNILGQLDGFCVIGEIRHIWERGLLKNRLCGCGAPIRECEMWKNVMAQAYGGLDQIDAQEMVLLTESFRTKDLLFTLIPNVRRGQISRLSEYLKNLEILYRAIQSTTGCQVIVDSSKNAAYGYMLRMLPAIDLYILHIVRNSQAVAYSWSKKKFYQPGEYMPRKTSVNSAMVWNARNITVEMFLGRPPERSMTLRYEDFVSNPRVSVEAILNLLDKKNVKLPFVAPDTVELGRTNHSVHGNEVRFQNGPVTLKLDSTWQTKMNKKDKLTVKALTWPLQIKYGYL